MALADPAVEALQSVLVERCNDSGDLLGIVQLDPEYFGAHVNVPLLHQVVTAQLAAKRSGTHSTKTRAEVSGGGAKPYRQKGTGRARQGTIRAPQFAGGGIVFGPKPRDYSQSTPRKMVRQALRAALSDRASESRICLVDHWSFEVPKTKQAASSLKALGVDGEVLLVISTADVVAERSFGNLPHVNIVEAGQLTAYDVIASDWVVFTDETVPGQVSDAPDGSVVVSSRPVRTAAEPDVAAEAPAVVGDEEEEADDAVGAHSAAADDEVDADEPAADEVDADEPAAEEADADEPAADEAIDEPEAAADLDDGENAVELDEGDEEEGK